VEVDVDVDVYFVALFDRQVWVCLTEVELNTGIGRGSSSRVNTLR